MKLTTRELVILAIFGTLWGTSEIGLGSVMHALHIPMAGAVLSALGLTIAMIGRAFVPKKGSTLFIGVIAMILKLLSLGSAIIGPMIGILAGALIAELVLSAFGRPSRWAFMAAVGLAVTWTLAQPFVTGLLLFGRDAFVIWLEMLEEGRKLLRLKPEVGILILLTLIALRLAMGILGGLLAWKVAKVVQIRLRGSTFHLSGSD